MEKSTKLSKPLLLNIILFGFMGQVAWAVENNFFNMYLFNRIGGNEYDIANMVAASAATASFTIGVFTIRTSARRAGILLSINSVTIPIVPEIISRTL